MNNEVKRIKIHFMYVVIILSLIGVYLGGALLIGHDGTVQTLSNGSLLLSIVLAVVAILITLWDVAGQKSNIVSLQGMIRGLRKIIIEFEKISEENGTAINELRDVVIELNERVLFYEKKFAQIESLINNSDETTEITNDLKLLLDYGIHTGVDNNLDTKVIISSPKQSEFIQSSGRTNRPTLTEVIKLLKMEFKKNEVFSFKSFFELLNKNYSISASIARSVLNELIQRGELEEHLDNDGSISYKLLKN
ncbi:hypothetical protein NDK43_06940 [Neobacillus pocheonensis]|uniref:Uncharacterized protein n=1 Tax=Neobacillus pocheonensis TaxID=363869 RepID=A0ABT0W786_9BACI|nr:hypothetical protein [Neobacillus pocheonensis]